MVASALFKSRLSEVLVNVLQGRAFTVAGRKEISFSNNSALGERGIRSSKSLMSGHATRCREKVLV